MAAFLPILLGFEFVITYGLAIAIIWALANGIAKDRFWAKATFVTLTVLSLPTRASSLFYMNSMFDGAKFRLSFFVILAWCIGDMVLIYNVCFSTKEEAVKADV